MVSKFLTRAALGVRVAAHRAHDPLRLLADRVEQRRPACRAPPRRCSRASAARRRCRRRSTPAGRRPRRCRESSRGASRSRFSEATSDRSADRCGCTSRSARSMLGRGSHGVKLAARPHARDRRARNRTDRKCRVLLDQVRRSWPGRTSISCSRWPPKIDDIVRQEGAAPAALAEYRYPLERARDFVRIVGRRFEARASLTALRSLCDAYERYLAIAAGMRGADVPAVTPRRRVRRSRRSRCVRPTSSPRSTRNTGSERARRSWALSGACAGGGGELGERRVDVEHEVVQVGNEIPVGGESPAQALRRS